MCPISRQNGQRGEIGLVFSAKDRAATQVIHRLEHDIPIRALDTQQRAKRKKPIGFLLLFCDFRCSPADCSTKLKFALAHRETPFAVLKLLPLNKQIQTESVFALCFLESVDLYPDQEESVMMLRDSQSYSKNLISRLNPGQIVLRVLSLQTDIAENPRDLLDPKKSAEKFGLSPSWLSHKFREISGLTLERFILKNRFCLALWNIISTDIPIKSIALDLGYKPGSFSERFKKEFGASPSFIRK